MLVTNVKCRPIIVFLVTFTLLLLLSCAPSAPTETTPGRPSEPVTSPNDDAETSVPGKPTNLVLTVEPGTTQLSADWDPVMASTSYQVQWRLRRQSFATDANRTSTESDAEIALPSQGNWIIRVQACNDHGCGQPLTSSTDVIINVLGHTAVRAWATDHTLEVDWDSLPGKYQVKYRLSTDNSKWKTSQLLDNPGLSISATDLQDFAGTGHPIVRVYFDCDTDGEQCSLLGRWPDRSVQDANAGQVPPPPPPAMATGAQSVAATPDRIPDPITGVLRPRSDFTFTTEDDTDDGGSWSCVSRPSENRWEAQNHGDTVKRCSRNRVETEEPYELDPSATFPDGAICGTRKSKTEEDRQIYGDTVRVCNRHPDPNDDGTSTPQPGPSGSTHTGDSHQVGWAGWIPWAVNYAQSYGSLGPCTYGTVYNSDRYGVRLHPDWNYTTKVRARWCYRYRSHVGKVQTLKYSTTTTIPSTWYENLMQMRFCGWLPGNPTIITSIHDDRHESEWQWYYRHPVVRAVLPWGYGTYVRPWYGNTAKIIRSPDGQAVGIIRDCTDQLLRNQTFLIGDWEGQATLYNAYSD